MRVRNSQRLLGSPLQRAERFETITRFATQLLTLASPPHVACERRTADEFAIGVRHAGAAPRVSPRGSTVVSTAAFAS